ncbi:CRISP/Allergen/PR-1-like [Uloborus diversus]|uniref:CRISP/Allergen/PR-1-like n=1 Tax=Uloborus diversus TaxID=327109 RepID=UPI0024093974|nr:CRISP/Allergen/PR-1-like [Uloborus diversus]XP_054709531.1 CRISP/Allergen/PR-1-like [Uloborus diversus]
MDLVRVTSVLTFVMMMIGMTASQTCLPIFLRYNEKHSYCQPKNPSCNILATYVTDDEKVIIVDEHNKYRSKIAAGKELKLPSAGNMLQMEWDDELAAVAQKYAEQCQFSHDPASARRVQNFGVGQNIALETLTNTQGIPAANWPWAVQIWYDELQYFSKGLIDPFVTPPSDPTYGHFSQLAWAESWKVGCGYVLHQEGATLKKLYICNYGPAGNMLPGSMYKIGQPCSACPVNSCCDKTCGSNAEYSGLCKITDGRAPTYKSQESYLFYCDFTGQSDCAFTFMGINDWKVYTTLSGSYMGIVLDGGQESTITFSNTIKPTSNNFCVTVNYRKGPDADGQADSIAASESFTIPAQDFSISQSLPTYSGDARQQFAKYSMTLSWNQETQVSIAVSVPSGSAAQFFEIKDIAAQDGECKK